jgi:hypothetical protein
VVGRIVLLLVVALVSCTGLPAALPAATTSQASAQNEIAKPSAIADTEGERARVPKRPRQAPLPARPALLRAHRWPVHASMPARSLQQLSALHAETTMRRLDARAHDRRASVRRIRVTARIPRMGDDDPPAA